MQTRRVRIGCTFTYVAEIDTPVVFHVQPRHAPDIALAGAQLGAEPEMALRDYTDLYGNPCTRAILPSGRSRFSYGAVATVPDATEDADEDAPEIPPDKLPDDTLIYTLPSRFCLPDLLGDEAWSQFGALPPGYRRVHAICDYVNGHLTFAYGSTTATSTAADVFASGRGVCRDFTHLAISFCRALNIPARYVFGYLPDMDVPPDPAADGLRGVDGGLAGGALVDLRPAQQPAAQGAHRDRPGPRRLGCGHGHDVRRPAAGGDAGDGRRGPLGMARGADDARRGAAALRGRAVLAQHGQEFLVRANEEGLVAGPEPGTPPGRVLQQLLVGATSICSSARPTAGLPSWTTTAGTPDWLSSSTMRRPTKRRPHTITWPRQSAYPPVTRASSRFSMMQMLAARMRGMIIPGATWPARPARARFAGGRPARPAPALMRPGRKAAGWCSHVLPALQGPPGQPARQHRQPVGRQPVQQYGRDRGSGLHADPGQPGHQRRLDRA